MMKKIVLDFGTCSTKKEIHAYLKEQFGFPDYYGENLDALYDCLTDLAEDVKICFEENGGDACCKEVQEAEGQKKAEGIKEAEKSREPGEQKESGGTQEPKEEKESGEAKEVPEFKESKRMADEKIRQYLKKVRWVIGDAAEENSHLYL